MLVGITGFLDNTLFFFCKNIQLLRLSYEDFANRIFPTSHVCTSI